MELPYLDVQVGDLFISVITPGMRHSYPSIFMCITITTDYTDYTFMGNNKIFWIHNYRINCDLKDNLILKVEYHEP